MELTGIKAGGWNNTPDCELYNGTYILQLGGESGVYENWGWLCNYYGTIPCKVQGPYGEIVLPCSPCFFFPDSSIPLRGILQYNTESHPTDPNTWRAAILDQSGNNTFNFQQTGGPACVTYVWSWDGDWGGWAQSRITGSGSPFAYLSTFSPRTGTHHVSLGYAKVTKTFTICTGGGTLTVYHRNREGEIYVNGSRVHVCSRAFTWTKYTYSLSAGTNTIELWGDYDDEQTWFDDIEITNVQSGSGALDCLNINGLVLPKLGGGGTCCDQTEVVCKISALT